MGSVDGVRIGELSDVTGTPATTLRYYESVGLLAPPRRSSAGHRAYPPDAVERVEFIKRAKGSGLSLDEIGSILSIKDAGGRSCAHTRSLIERHLAELDEQLASLRRARDELADLADRAAGLDPADCTDPNRCQVLAAD